MKIGPEGAAPTSNNHDRNKPKSWGAGMTVMSHNYEEPEWRELTTVISWNKLH